jgi:putative transposase
MEREIVKCRKIRIKVNNEQKKVIDEWMHTSRYVYNKTLAAIKNGEHENSIMLRNKYVTEKPRNGHRNVFVQDWEVNTPKEVRGTAVRDVCNAYKTARANKKAGNIKFFNISFKKKSSFDQCIGIQKASIKVKDSHFEIYSRRLIPIKKGKRTKIKAIDYDCRLVKQKNRYFLCIPIKEKTKVNNVGYSRVVGIDPGVRKFMTTFSDTSCQEYRQRRDLLKKLNEKIDNLRNKRMKPLKKLQRNGYYKKHINKYEIKKENLIDQIHWQTITSLTKTNDVIFYGDIKSHDIVKKYNNRHLNREIMDLKFFKFKERLRHKCFELNKVFIAVNECYTSKTCTNCGILNDVKDSETYKCTSCNITIDRDINGARNILLKGLDPVCVPSR